MSIHHVQHTAHTYLLKVRCKTMHVLIIGQDRMRLRIVKVVVPHAKHRKNDLYNVPN